MQKYGLIINLYKQKHIKCIWHLVVAAALWTIWLARNDLIFNKVRISEKVLQELLFLRVSKWGSASKTISFSHVPLWKVNPVGAINVHHHLDVSNYWNVCLDQFHAVCMVDAAWTFCDRGLHRGGIGGLIKNKSRTLYCFSGPSLSKNIHEAEIEAVLHILRIIIESELHTSRVVVCQTQLRPWMQFMRDWIVLFLCFVLILIYNLFCMHALLWTLSPLSLMWRLILWHKMELTRVGFAVIGLK